MTSETAIVTFLVVIFLAGFLLQEVAAYLSKKSNASKKREIVPPLPEGMAIDFYKEPDGEIYACTNQPHPTLRSVGLGLKISAYGETPEAAARNLCKKYWTEYESKEQFDAAVARAKAIWETKEC